MTVPAKWVSDLRGDTPIAEAGARVLKEQLGAVSKHLRKAHKPLGAKPVHAMRVATRRGAAMLRLFKPWLDDESGRACRRLERRLKRVRRAAGVMRDADVHAEVFQRLREHAGGAHLPVLDYLLERIETSRGKGRKGLARAAERAGPRRLRRLRRSVVAGVERVDSQPTLADATARWLPGALAGAREAAAKDLAVHENLHDLRVLLKGLRYSLELVGLTLGGRYLAEVHPRLTDLQDRLGEVNDAQTVVTRLDAEVQRLEEGGRGPGRMRQGMEALRERQMAVRDRRVERFLDWWRAFDMTGLLDALEAAMPNAGAGAIAPPVLAIAPGAGLAETNGHHGASESSCRLAAIDVGSNSTRLVIAETHPDGAYRVIDDEKELTRLARGLAESGKLDPSVMDRAATVIARMKAIAAGYNCTMVRAIATAAVREAANGGEFVELVKARSGLDLRIISADEEARLAFRSVLHAFGDMHTLAAGTMDIGGGSTEIVLSTRGVVDEVYTLPMGAVGLTERFGGAEKAAGAKFEAMRRYVRRELAARMPDAGINPELIVGTGGTVTALAAMAIRRDRSAGGEGGGPATVRGYQVRRSDVRRLLDELREMPLDERGAVPGLSAERADIIVAGLAIVLEVMRHLGARRLRVHDLGVRDGLILSMIREVFPRSGERPAAGAAAVRPGRVAAARRFARACRYEELHSERVAALSLQLFDAMTPNLPAPQTLWTVPVSRELLEAGAVLHDIGYIINYAGHHKHGYHLIVHSDLAGESGGFNLREAHIVANLARYHRRSVPKERHANFKTLCEEDRQLVRCLAAILRVADGLDRTHTQNVEAVRVRLEPGVAVFEITAEQDPATDVWGASRKAELFQEVFGLQTRFEWVRPAPEPPMVETRREREPQPV